VLLKTPGLNPLLRPAASKVSLVASELFYNEDLSYQTSLGLRESEQEAFHDVWMAAGNWVIAGNCRITGESRRGSASRVSRVSRNVSYQGDRGLA